MLKALKASRASIRHNSPWKSERVYDCSPLWSMAIAWRILSTSIRTSLHLQGDNAKQPREKPRKVQGSQPCATPEGDGASPSNFTGRFTSQLKTRCEVLLDIAE